MERYSLLSTANENPFTSALTNNDWLLANRQRLVAPSLKGSVKSAPMRPQVHLRNLNHLRADERCHVSLQRRWFPLYAESIGASS
jgi:hypothetical protein